MNQNSQLKFELTGAAADSEYFVHSRLEIASILRDVMTGNSLISVYFDASNASLLTALLAVDVEAGRLLLDSGPDPKVNERLARAYRLVCVTSLDKVKIQFVAGAARPVQSDGRPAFQLPLPDKLLRLQRREYFRLSTPISSPLKCTITPIAGEAGGSHQLSVADISGGGFAANSGIELPEFEPMSRFSGVITLPDGDVLRADVQLRNTFEITLANGKRIRRYGWQFLDLSDRARVALEKYVMQQQRLQKARSGSLI